MKKFFTILLLFTIFSCASTKEQKTKTSIIQMEKEHDGIFKSWVSHEPTYMRIYRGEKVLKIYACKITFVKLYKRIELHFDYEYDRYDYYPINGRQIFDILIYDNKENLLENIKHSVEIKCFGDGFAGKYKHTLRNIKKLKDINEIGIFPQSHEWLECSFRDEEYDFNFKLDGEKCM